MMFVMRLPLQTRYTMVFFVVVVVVLIIVGATLDRGLSAVLGLGVAQTVSGSVRLPGWPPLTRVVP